MREFIPYRSRDKGQNLRNLCVTNLHLHKEIAPDTGNPALIDGNIYNILDNDVQANYSSWRLTQPAFVLLATTPEVWG